MTLRNLQWLRADIDREIRDLDDYLDETNGSSTELKRLVEKLYGAALCLRNELDSIVEEQGD